MIKLKGFSALRVLICVKNSKLVFSKTETSYGTAGITDGQCSQRNSSILFAVVTYTAKFAEL
jgi:hypothetical protein